MTVNISETITPNSQQVNAEDLIGGPVTVTVTGVEKGTAEQPIFIHLAEFEGRTFRPAKTVRRIIVAAWGPEAATYTGRRLTIYNDPTVKWAGQEIGGVRISHMSHIDKPLSVLLSVSRGKRQEFTVQPLKPEFDESAVVDALANINGAESIPALKTAWELAGVKGAQKHPDVIEATNKRKAELT
ncbi:hypothetical protein FVO59_11810 [Microbacterium esteraromaticum]|uniref:Uncharacterized protein n=1 Tax=Microbacterium esteraromaticum TaxID=57043 RepID=A0A7D7WHP0_9MICO|nr:hypothetical protein [Microbacterium esteraromaticum]QMU97814.1 hypothetical protein FVO59_11810 [Microbacterium esteraromaticum]